MLDPRRILKKKIRTSDEIDKPATRNRALIVLALAGVVVAAAIRWWMTNGQGFAQDIIHQASAFQSYWSVASDADKTTWKLIALSILIALVLAIVLLHRFVWRAFFPDLRRLDVRMHTGGMSERVGRLYRIRALVDGDKTWYRHYYKNGNRWLPLFRFDHVDLDAPAQHAQYGVALIRCGRLERDPTGNAFKRVPSEATFGAAPLGTSFRANEVSADQERKTNIVGPGAGMNPEVMRKKWHNEPMINAWPDDRPRGGRDEASGSASVQEGQTRP